MKNLSFRSPFPKPSACPPAPKKMGKKRRARAARILAKSSSRLIKALEKLGQAALDAEDPDRAERRRNRERSDGHLSMGGGSPNQQ